MDSPTAAFAPIHPKHVCIHGLGDLIGWNHEKCQREHYLPAYLMSLQALAGGRSVDAAAVATGWLGLLLHGDLGAIICQVTMDENRQPSRIGHVSHPSPEQQAKNSWNRAQIALDKIAEVQDIPQSETCELSWLRIPGILFEGFWLKSKNQGHPGWVVPVFFLEDDIQARAYTVPEFLTVAQALAKKRLGVDNSPLLRDHAQG
jgi:hypothetical protein